MLYFVYNTATNRSECIIIKIYNALTEVHYLDIALAVVLCNVAQVLAANAATKPHLIFGKTLDCVLEFLYSLT